MFNAKYITLAQYNDQVTSFDYGYTELSSKPNELSPQCFLEKFRYSASEMLLLARVLPFIIGDKVPEDDEYYNCFLRLLKCYKLFYFLPFQMMLLLIFVYLLMTITQCSLPYTQTKVLFLNCTT